MITVDLTQSEFNDLVAKAENWDILGDEINDQFQQFNDVDMIRVGEIASLAFGFIE